MTNIGNINTEDFKILTANPKNFNQDYFLWPNEQKDAWYYRNAAIIILRTISRGCPFLYMRIAKAAEYFKIARQINPKIPMPVELCKTINSFAHIDTYNIAGPDFAVLSGSKESEKILETELNDLIKYNQII